MDNTTSKVKASVTCWVCGTEDFKLKKESSISNELTSENFAITDSSYGTTTSIYECTNCGFLQCLEFQDVLKFYEELKDYSYEASRKPRSIQMKKILDFVGRFKSSGRLLDVGAGSGILIEEAIKKGYVAEGLEPSKWLQAKAIEHNLLVYHGALPNSQLKSNYDVITLVDVLEHVANPKELLKSVKNLLVHDGILVIITPDVGSMAAKIFGWKWWHFRIAHIGYFNKHTLNKLLDISGFKLVKLERPSWYFSLDYLFERAFKCIPLIKNFITMSILKKIIIPLNLRDSLLGIYTRKEET